MLSVISCSTKNPNSSRFARVLSCSLNFPSVNFSSDRHCRSSQHSHTAINYKNAYYNQSALSSSIEMAASKTSHRVKPGVLLQMGKSKDKVIRTAQFLHKELPVRIAHRIENFLKLPFSVGSNSNILEVTDMYREAFEKLHDFPEIESTEDEVQYAHIVSSLLNTHTDVINKLAEGFSQCRKHIEVNQSHRDRISKILLQNDVIRKFLDRTLASRLGIRMLCTHYLHLREEKPDHVGIVNVKFSPSKLIHSKAEFVREFCEDKYGHAPRVIIQGHEHAVFPYISPPLDYILVELLKNAFRSTLEFHEGSMDNIPPVVVTIANNDIDFIVRISDRGGGIDHFIINKIWDYNFTTSGLTQNSNMERGLFGEMMKTSNSLGKMHGYGFGLPASRAYAEYLGGSLTLETMQGYGSDVYLRLRKIVGKHETFRI